MFGQDAHQITSDDQIFSNPSYSHDGKEIAFTMGSSDPMSGVQHVYAMDRNGEALAKIITKAKGK
jgi:Tol biopolymer transport system component